MSATTAVILAPRYLGTVEYYAAMASCPVAVIDVAMRHDKRFKHAHRTVIAGNAGPLQLTVPVAHGPGQVTWQHVAVSDHNHWWEQHTAAIASAYGRCPYFEHYFPLISGFLTAEAAGQSVVSLDTRLDAAIRRILGMPTRLSATVPAGVEAIDLRTDAALSAAFSVAPYRQLRQDKFGFLPGMSILDIIFNLGPNALAHLTNPQPSKT